jgi:hypothetical protein
MTVSSFSLNRLCPRAVAALAALSVLALLALGAGARAADPIPGEIEVFTDGGFARLVFHFEQEVPATVKINFPIVVVTFKKPVAIPVDHLSEKAPAYISAARADPDGLSIRIALRKKVRINTIPAAERLFVDLLPEPWTGVLPGLPQEVIAELARRAQQAERLLRRQHLADKDRKPPTIRVKVASQPTFIRYVFDLPDGTNAVPDRHDDKLTLNFDQPIKWDLADAVANLPPTLSAINTDIDYGSVAVTFTLNGKPKVRTFHEDRSIAVDIGLDGAKPKQTAKADAAANAAPALTQPDTVPANDEGAPDRRAHEARNGSAPPLIDVKPPMPAAHGLAAAAKELNAKLAAAVAHKTAAPPPPQPAAVEAAVAAPATPASPKIAAAPAPKVKASAAAPVAKTASKAAANASVPAPDPKAPVAAELHQDGDNLRIEFPFVAPTPAAVFRRADMLWLVFDSPARIDLSALTHEPDSGIRAAHFERSKDGAALVRLRLTQPRLVGAMTDGPAWIVSLGDKTVTPTQPLAIARSIVGKNRASIAIPFDHPRAIHRIVDPAIGDRLMVVTALAPARGFLKTQNFVELRALPSAQGVVLQPLADDIAAALAVDKVMISRPGGLSLSSTAIGQQRLSTAFRALTFDTQLWGFNRHAKYETRQFSLIRDAAMAPTGRRRKARLDLARFYLANGMSAEAKGVLQVALAGEHGEDDITGTVLKAVANVMLDRPEDALKDLSDPQVGNQLDAPVWRAVAFAKQGQWAQAHERFKDLDAVLGGLPIQLQRMALREELHAAIEVHDFSGADRVLNELETLGVPPEMQASIAVLVGRLDQGLGRNEDALTNYRTAATAQDQAAAAQGRLRELELRYAMGDMPRKDAIDKLETLTTVWRGDQTEVEGLKLLAHLYTEDKRYRAAFHVMKVVKIAYPNSDITRQIQDEAAATFEKLFLGGAGASMPPIEALGLFYDYRELTPIGRRGDEMIRKLADRLVSVDLLDQAAELLQHQVDKRLQGAARAQVATRLAMIYLMNRKSDRALATLRATRTEGLSNDLRDQRLLLEARALSETGRHDLALEMIANMKSHQAIRLRADILWAGKHWTKAAEQIELLYGERWKQFAPLSEAERIDILRAAIGYTLGDEPMDLARLRDKYAAKMADTPDRHAFDVVSAPIGASSNEFQTVARMVSGIDTLDAFLSDMRKRYPDSSPVSDDGGDAANKAAAAPKPEAAKPPAKKPEAKAAAPEQAAVNAKPAQPAPAKASKPAPGTTGSIGMSPR